MVELQGAAAGEDLVAWRAGGGFWAPRHHSLIAAPRHPALTCPSILPALPAHPPQYRTSHNYRSMEYLGPRMFDKIIFSVVSH